MSIWKIKSLEWVGVRVCKEKAFTKKWLRLRIVRVENGRDDKRDANHAEGDQEEQQTRLDYSWLDAFLVAGQTDRFDKQMRERQKHEERQIREQKD